MTTAGLQNGSFYYFLRLPGPANLGHMGWGFQLSEDRWCFGALENTGSQPVVRNGDNDYWLTTADSEAEMFCEMRTAITASRLCGKEISPYTCYKQILVERPDPSEAEAVARSHTGYDMIGNNCLDNAVRISDAYGVRVWSWLRHTLDAAPADYFDDVLWQYTRRDL
jgi:hypothetical protein